MKWSKIKSDIKQMAIPLIAICLYILLGNLIIGKICPTRILFGIPCPICGTTRAVWLLFQGKFVEAVAVNPLWIPLIVLGMIFLINRYFVTSEKMSDKILRILKIAVVVVCVLCIVYYVYRMIYWYPDRTPMLYDPDNLLQRLGIIKNI